MGFEKDIVDEAELEALFELALDEGFEGAEHEEVFEGSPKSFDERDGAGFSDGAETLSDAELLQGVFEELGGKLRALI